MLSKRYKMYTQYTDGVSKQESNNDIVPLLDAAAIYLRDESCIICTIQDMITGKMILNILR
jgi:hypothetical protein